MKLRRDSFFGLHFDFHANPNDNVTVGETLCEEDIRKICRAIRPDFIQIDCKGHPGWTSYPTSLGNAMPSIKGDPLMLWRRVTREEGVALYMHYSGLYDIKYCSDHEDSSVLLADGTVREGFNRFFDRYADELLIPQISELAEKYGIDGVWIDGDSWAVIPDFHADALGAFEREKGISFNGVPPATPNDPYYYEYRDHFRELFRNYVRRYVDILHERFPNLQIASNWAYTDNMPEKISSGVDFISGDLNPVNSFNSARYAARAIAHQEYTWDLMAWNFRAYTPVGSPDKHPIQILQEAAAVIALGGGFQNYIMQDRDGSPNMGAIEKMTALAEFMRSREAYCFKGKPIHQTAMLLSTYDRAHEVTTRVYNRHGYEKQMGLTSLLCDSGVSLETVFEYALKERYSDYPMIVIPELCYGLDDETVSELIAYAENGGNLLLIGNRTCSLFSKAGLPFSVRTLKKYKNDPTDQNDNGHDTGSGSELLQYRLSLRGDHYTAGALVSPAEIIADGGDILAEAVYDKKKSPLAILLPFGKGKIAAVGFDIGSQYLNCGQYLHRELIKDISGRMYTPKAKIEAVLGTAELIPLLKDGRLMLQIINANGNHSNPNYITEDHIPPLLDLKLSVECGKKDTQIILRPEGKRLSAEYKDGRLFFTVDRVDIHSIVEIIEN